TLIFHDGLELPDFAAFHLLKTAEGEAALRKYFRTYAEIAKRFATGLVLESATWRASADWGTRLGYTSAMLADANRRAVQLLEEEAEAYHRPQVETFAGSAADMVSAITMNYVEEAIGIARAAQRANMPVAIS